MPLTLTKRMDLVEQRLADLDVLPDRITALESQFLLLRDEMRAEFSAIRVEMQGSDEMTEGPLLEVISRGHEGLRVEIRAGDEKLRDEIRAGDEETRTLMRILHEDVITRIATTQEGRNGRQPRKR